jgi:hypothetical protein
MNAQLDEQEKKPTPIRKRRRKSQALPPVPAAEEEEEATDVLPEASALEVEIPPAEPAHASFLDRAKARLGLSVDKPDVQPKAASPRLTKGQQEFIEVARPIAAQIGVELGAFAWEKVGGYDYRILAPSEDIAEKIMLPWCRILARTFAVKYKGKVTPNQLDMGASLLALAGYSLSSVRMYRAIKNEEKYAGQEEEATTRPRGTTGAVRPERQAVHDVANRVPVSGPENRAVSPDRGSIRGSAPDSGSNDLRNLSPEERRQYERLNQLRLRDIESRRRRAGLA